MRGTPSLLGSFLVLSSVLLVAVQAGQGHGHGPQAQPQRARRRGGLFGGFHSHPRYPPPVKAGGGPFGFGGQWPGSHGYQYSAGAGGNYAFSTGSHAHHHPHSHPQLAVRPGPFSSLTKAFAPVEPPTVSIAPIIPYEPEQEHQHHHHAAPLSSHYGGGGGGNGLDLGLNNLNFNFQDLGLGGAPEPGPAPLAVAPAPEPEPVPLSPPISKSVYVFSAPSTPEERIRPQVVKRFPQQRQKHYQVVFINAPNPPLPAQHTVELPPPPELKTQVYVLVKKPEGPPPVNIIPAKVPVHKPEVYFIRYKNKEEATAFAGAGGIAPSGFVPVPSDGSIGYPHHHHQGQVLEDVQYQVQGHEGYGAPEVINGIGGYAAAPLDAGHGHGHGPAPGYAEVVSHDHVHANPDPYSDYSRLNAHYSTISGTPVYMDKRLAKVRSRLQKLFSQKGSKAGSSNSNRRSFSVDNSDWIPIPKAKRETADAAENLEDESSSGI